MGFSTLSASSTRVAAGRQFGEAVIKSASKSANCEDVSKIDPTLVKLLEGNQLIFPKRFRSKPCPIHLFLLENRQSFLVPPLSQSYQGLMHLMPHLIQIGLFSASDTQCRMG